MEYFTTQRKEFILTWLKCRNTISKLRQIPRSIGKLTKLRTLFQLTPNQLNGTIPATIGNLTNLVELHLSFGLFSGSLPMEIFSLRSIILDNNHDLAWTIPPEIANLKQLQSLSARNCGLRGTLPNEISHTIMRVDFIVA